MFECSTGTHTIGCSILVLAVSVVGIIQYALVPHYDTMLRRFVTVRRSRCRHMIRARKEDICK